MDDPRAWAALMGSREQDKAAQSTAFAAARAEVVSRERAAPELDDLPLMKRAQLVDSLEDTLGQLTASKATVISARLHRSGAGYLFCGSALYGYGGAGDLYVFDTNPGGVVTAHASAEDFVKDGCTQAGTGLMLR